MSYPRSLLRHQYITQNNYLPEKVVFLASDMSARQYYRLSYPQRVLMDAPFPENPAQFIAVAHYLQDQGLRTPQVFDHHLEHGFVWLEDFGDHTFSRVLKQNPEREHELYHMAVHVLKHLHQKAQIQPDFMEPYTVNHLLTEVTIFIDWYWPTVHTQKQHKEAKLNFLSAWQEALKSLPILPESVVLRDYHVDNLMLVPGQTILEQCGLLDFQDALWGSVTYDFISLLEDARRDVSPSLQQTLWQVFLADIPTAHHQDYYLAATLLGAARHTKVIGVFTRYALRQGRADYLCHLPRLWSYLKTSLQHPTLQPVLDWFNHYLPLKNQGIPSL